MSKKYILLPLLGVVIIGGVVWLFASGRLVWSNSGANKTARVVCGTDIVDTYNDAMYMIGRNGSSEPTIDESGVKSVQSAVRNKTGYKDDATCQTLLFWIAIHDGDYQAAKDAEAAVKLLHDKGQFANNNIRGNDAILTYDIVLYGISPEAKAKAGAS
jgi:hypothetical protein